MNQPTPIAVLVERMLAAGVPNDVIVLAIRTAEGFSAKSPRGESAEKAEKRRAADRGRKRKKYELSKVSKASATAGHKKTSAKISTKTSADNPVEKVEDSFFLSSLTDSQDGNREGRKKELTDVVLDDWPDGYGAQFWFGFPKKRRYGKPQVMALLAKMRRENTVTWTTLFAAVQQYAASDPGQYAKAPLPWLREHRWEVDYELEGMNGNEKHRGYSNRTDDLDFSGLAARLRAGHSPDSI